MSTPMVIKNSSPFGDLFVPLVPIQGGADKVPETASNAATTPSSGQPASETPREGTVTQSEVFSSLNHTQIASVSGSGTTGTPGAAPATPGSSVALGGMVQGEWAVNILDAILPAALVAGFYALGVKLRKSELQLTASEKNTLSPIMQKCLDTVLLNFSNPWNALLVTLGAIYGGKAMEKGLVAWVDRSQEKKESEALKERVQAAAVAANPAQYDLANQSADDIQAGRVALPGDTFSEEEIKNMMRKAKCNREKAIKKLERLKGVA